MHPTCAPSRRPESGISFLSMLMSPPALYEPGFAEGASINKLENLGKSDTVSCTGNTHCQTNSLAARLYCAAQAPGKKVPA